MPPVSHRRCCSGSRQRCIVHPERSESPPYSQGLATAYVFGGELTFSRRMSRWILRTLCQGHVGRMLDVACGAGEAVRVFHEAGWQAFGLDRSEAMLELAR